MTEQITLNVRTAIHADDALSMQRVKIKHARKLLQSILSEIPHATTLDNYRNNPAAFELAVGCSVSERAKSDGVLLQGYELRALAHDQGVVEAWRWNVGGCYRLDDETIAVYLADLDIHMGRICCNLHPKR